MSTKHNVSSFIFSCTKKFETRPCFIIKEAGGHRRPVSYLEFNETVLKLSVVLREIYPEPGFKIGLWGENRMEWAAMALAIWHAGGILVPISNHGSDPILNIMGVIRLDGLFVSPKVVRSTDFGVPMVFSLDFATSKDNHGRLSLGDILQQTKFFTLPKTQDTATLADDVAVLLFTPDITGQLTRVMITHGHILTSLADILDRIPVNQDDRIVSTMPLSQIFELVEGFLLCHALGGCISFVDTLNVDDVVVELKSHKATALFSEAPFFRSLDQKLGEEINQLPMVTRWLLDYLEPSLKSKPILGKIIYRKIHESLGGAIRFFVSSGARIDIGIMERFKVFGISMYQGSDLIEASSRKDPQQEADSFIQGELF